jgi:hypothetical protein
MPVFIYEHDALQRMAQVEGSRWMDKQIGITESSSDWSVSFNGFLDAYRKAVASGESAKTPPRSLSVHDKQGFLMPVIYGRNGYNRYSVLSSGEIEFLHMQAATREDTEKAKRVGFRLVPEETAPSAKERS